MHHSSTKTIQPHHSSAATSASISPVALFYATLTPRVPKRGGGGGHSNSTGNGSSGSALPKAAPTSAVQRRALERRHDVQRERGWRLGGNEAHNLPSVFPPPDQAAAAAAAASGTSASASASSHTVHHRHEPQPPAQPASPSRTVVRGGGGGVGAERGLLQRLRDAPVLVHVLKFLPAKPLAACAAAGWCLAVAVRPVAASRARRRLVVVAALDQEAAVDRTPTMAEAEAMVASVQRRDVNEVRRLTRSVPAVVRLGEHVALCFGAGGRHPTWADFLRLAQDTGLCTRMAGFDKKLLTTRLLERLSPFIHDPESSVDRLRSVSGAAGNLCRWLHGVYAVGVCLFRPWQMDRVRARQTCQTYLEQTLLAAPLRLEAFEAGVRADADRAEAGVEEGCGGGGGLTTHDSFGRMLV